MRLFFSKRTVLNNKQRQEIFEALGFQVYFIFLVSFMLTLKESTLEVQY